jgi:hypothetical protein
MNDVTFSAGALVIISGMLTTIVGGMVGLFRLLLAAKDHEIDSVTRQRDAYEKLAIQSVGAMEAAVNRNRKEAGHAPFDVIPPVVPQHNSPITDEQQYDANLETLKARAAAARRALGILPGEEPS